VIVSDKIMKKNLLSKDRWCCGI